MAAFVCSSLCVARCRWLGNPRAHPARHERTFAAARSALARRRYFYPRAFYAANPTLFGLAADLWHRLTLLHGSVVRRRGLDGISGPRFSPWAAPVPFKANQDRRHHFPKQRHRGTNWAAYDIAWRQRGSLTVCFTETAIAAWKAEPRCTRGGQPPRLTSAAPGTGESSRPAKPGQMFDTLLLGPKLHHKLSQPSH